MMDNEDALWDAIRRHDERLRIVENFTAAAEVREKSHQREIEEMMREFRSHAGQEEVSFVNLRRENSEMHKVLRNELDDIRQSLSKGDGAISVIKIVVPALLQAVIIIGAVLAALYKAGQLG